jgi:Tol biopolymer transport system component
MKRIKIVLYIAALAGLFMLMSGCFQQQRQVVKSNPVFSPDMKKIVFVSTTEGDPEIYVSKTNGTDIVKLTDNENVDANPSWSPDGNRILFISNWTGSFEIFVMNSDGTEQRMIQTDIPVSGNQQQ